MKVSVVIPAYNGDRFLGSAIDSVLQQTERDYEIIVVDDGSTDSTAQVAQQYNNIRYFRQTNQGVAASRNLGLAAAMGEYIVFLDQDDLLLPHKLSSQVALLDRDSELGIVNSGWQICHDDTHSLIQGQASASQTTEAVAPSSANSAAATVEPWSQIPDLSPADLIIWKPVFLGAMMFRRIWLERIGGFDPSLEQTPDVDLVLRLAKIGCPAAWVEQITVLYRQHAANASHNALLQAQELNQITANFFAQPNLNPELKKLESDSRYQSLIWAAWRLYETGHIQEMSHYLSQSQSYARQYPTEIPLNWLESFQNYSAEYGNQLDVNTLISSREWENLIKQCLRRDVDLYGEN